MRYNDRMRFTVPTLLVLLLPAWSACGSPGRSGLPERDLAASRSPAPAPGPDLLGWDEVSPLAFEELVESQLPGDRVIELDDFLLAHCERRLDVQDPGSVRAAVILGRSRCARAAEVLMRRLEKRVLGPARNSDAGDTVAAAALAGHPDGATYAARCEALAVGPDPHPDLEVRVECAVTALAFERDAVIPFLLTVLRIGTWKGLEDGRDFEASDTTAWARGRAAEALSRRADVPVTYRTDASIVFREEETERLHRTLRAMGLVE